LTAWIDKNTQLKESGRVRSERSDKGKKKNGKNGKAEPAGVVSAEKKVAHAAYKDDKDRAYSIEDYVTVLTKKERTLAKDRDVKPVRQLSRSEQIIRINGILDGLRFFLGDVSRLPDLTKDDFDVLKPAEPAAAEAE
jgi:hypothetical protein